MDYLGGPSVITRVLTRGKQESQSKRVREGAVMMDVEVRIMPLLEKAIHQKVRVASGSWKIKSSLPRASQRNTAVLML